MKVNSTLRFVTRDGSVVDRTIVRSRLVDPHGGHGFYGRDIVVGLLDSDVPNTISFAKGQWSPPSIKKWGGGEGGGGDT